jgi:hypothetical protein
MEIILGGVRPKPSDRSLAVFDLRWERRLARKTVLDARYGVTII